MPRRAEWRPLAGRILARGPYVGQACFKSFAFMCKRGQMVRIALCKRPPISYVYFIESVRLFWGHPFMTSTQRGRGSGSGGRMWTGGGGPAQCGRPHRQLKLESTDVILSSSHAKKLASFLPEL